MLQPRIDRKVLTAALKQITGVSPVETALETAARNCSLQILPLYHTLL